MNISRITQITEDGTWNSDSYGLYYQFLVTFEDGGHGQAKAKKKIPPYRVGDEVGYEYTGTYPKGQKLKITAKPYGDSGRQAPNRSAGDRPPARPAQPSRPPAAARGPESEDDQGGALTGEDRATLFHQKMKGNAALYLHCLSYARKIQTTLKAGGHAELSPDHFQACVSTLFIAGDRAGLALAPPPIGEAAPAPKPSTPPPERHTPQPERRAAPPKSAAAGEDEDVPF